MNTAVATTQAFQERMFERIRDQMGDLLTDEDLKRLVDSAMDRTFFAVPMDKYGRVAGAAPLVRMVDDMMKDRVQAAAAQWFKENEAKILPLIRDEIGKGMLACAAGFIERTIQQHMFNLGISIEDTLRNKGVLR